jgi:hypothetical protein
MNIPTLPSPPTDNLYKFMALSGVVLLLAAPFFWAKFYITHAERTRAAIESLGYSLPPPDYYFFRAKLLGGESVTEEQRKLVEKFDSLRKESSRLGGEFLLYDRFSYVVTSAAIFLGLLGLALTWFGFRLWYLRVQKPLDRILLKEAREADETPSNESIKATGL